MIIIKNNNFVNIYTNFLPIQSDNKPPKEEPIRAPKRIEEVIISCCKVVKFEINFSFELSCIAIIAI